jgi:hypothetical protein
VFCFYECDAGLADRIIQKGFDAAGVHVVEDRPPLELRPGRALVLLNLRDDSRFVDQSALPKAMKQLPPSAAAWSYCSGLALNDSKPFVRAADLAAAWDIYAAALKKQPKEK